MSSAGRYSYIGICQRCFVVLYYISIIMNDDDVAVRVSELGTIVGKAQR